MSWVGEEFDLLDLDDLRIDRRAINIIETLGLSPGRTIPQAFQSRGEIKGCYNFFAHSSVTVAKILKPHIEKTIERIQEFPVALLISDTSKLDYTSKESIEGKTRLTNKQKGFWLHQTIAVTPERLTLGSIEANFWERAPEVSDKSSACNTARDKAPIKEKETFRWLQSYLTACEVARKAPGTQIINVTDREGDIIEIFAEAQTQKAAGLYAQFIIRSNHDRILEETDLEDAKIHKKLRQKLKESSPLGEIEFAIPATEKRKARKVKQQVKATSVKLKSITKNGEKLEVEINVVMLVENDPPIGEKPLIWVLLTTLPIDKYEDILKVVKYYLCRWEIEIFFKVLKSGCKIEERQLQTADKMKNLIAIFMVLSWRVMYTMMLGRTCPELPCSDLFEEAEWKSVYKIAHRKKALPRKAPTLNAFIKMVATLGGYVEQKGGRPPGVKVMWKGMARMIDFAIAWDAFGG